MHYSKKNYCQNCDSPGSFKERVNESFDEEGIDVSMDEEESILEDEE
jgi:hypothetical protein